jgi:hypothetical protein
MSKKKKNSQKKNSLNLTQHWYYMNQEIVTVSDIAIVFDCKKNNIELWPDAGVLELGISEKEYLDIEECDLDMDDEYSNKFLAEHEIKSLFYVSFKAELNDLCMAKLSIILKKLGGILCADSEDFSPVITADTINKPI